MKLGCRYSISGCRMSSRLFKILIFFMDLKSGYLQLAAIKCDWSVQRWSLCPPYPTTDWHCLQAQLNCTAGEEYHCVRDESGEWTEICAKAITCSKGQEPVLKNSQIVCTTCRDSERYEPAEGTESYKYSECRRKKTTCPQDITHECPVDEAVRHSQNRLCRCAHEKDYMPQNYDLNTDTWICKEPDDLNCIHAPCPEDVYGNAQARGSDYRCKKPLLPVTATPSKKPTDRTSLHIVTQIPTRPARTPGPVEETEGPPNWIIGLILGILAAMLCSILSSTVYLLKKRNQLGAPVFLEAKDLSYFELHLSWQPPQQGYLPTYYILEQCEANSLNWVRIDKIPANESTEYDVKELKAGTLYKFRVIAEFENGKSKPCETESLVQTKPIKEPCMPQGLYGYFDESRKCLVLRWDEIDDDGGSEILKINVEYVKYLDESASDEKWVLFGSVTGNLNEWTTRNLTGGVTYKFRVCASNAAGTSEPAMTEKIKYLGVPDKLESIMVVDVIDYQVKLKWHPPADNGGTEIQYYHVDMQQNESNWLSIGHLKSSQKEFVTEVLRPGVYLFRICAENKVGCGDMVESAAPTKIEKKAEVKAQKLAGMKTDISDSNMSLQMPVHEAVTRSYDSLLRSDVSTFHLGDDKELTSQLSDLQALPEIVFPQASALSRKAEISKTRIDTSPINVNKISSLDIRLKQDKETCDTSGIAVTSKGVLLINDWNNRSVKAFSQDNKLLSSLTFSDWTYGISVINDQTAAVSTYNNKLHILNISDPANISIDRSVSLGYWVTGMTHYKGNLIGTKFYEQCVIMIDLNGQEKWSVSVDHKGQQLFDKPRSVTVSTSNDTSTVIVSDWGKDTLTLNDPNDGHLIKSIDVNGKNPTGLTSDNDGNVYVCFKRLKEICVFSPDFAKSHILLSNSDLRGYPQAIVYCSSSDVLYISYRQNDTVDCFQLA